MFGTNDGEIILVFFGKMLYSKDTDSVFGTLAGSPQTPYRENLKEKRGNPMENLFRLRENGTNVRTELLAGLTTFMTMAYIIALNPNLLTNFDVGSALWNGVFMATCIASAIGMFCMAFLANKPFALAPGMGLNSFFAVVVGNIAAMTGMTYVASFQAALVIILVELSLIHI